MWRHRNTEHLHLCPTVWCELMKCREGILPVNLNFISLEKAWLGAHVVVCTYAIKRIFTLHNTVRSIVLWQYLGQPSWAFASLKNLMVVTGFLTMASFSYVGSFPRIFSCKIFLNNDGHLHFCDVAQLLEFSCLELCMFFTYKKKHKLF